MARWRDGFSWADTLNPAMKQGLEAIVKAKVEEAIKPVLRRYTAEARCDGRVLVEKRPNAVIEMMLESAVDELVMGVKVDLELLLDPLEAEEVMARDNAARELAATKLETARAEAKASEMRWKERAAEAAGKAATSEEEIKRRAEAMYVEKERQLSKKITAADKAIEGALVTARTRVQAELIVIRAVCAWLRSWTTLALDEAAQRFALLDLDPAEIGG